MPQAEYEEGRAVVMRECFDENEDIEDEIDDDEGDCSSQQDEDNAAMIEELETHISPYAQHHEDFVGSALLNESIDWDPSKSPRKRSRRLD